MKRTVRAVRVAVLVGVVTHLGCAGGAPVAASRPTDAGASVAPANVPPPVALPAPSSPPPLPPLVTSAQAKVTLEMEKGTWFLGETVFVHYCVTNTTKAALVIEAGGDYRGASRHMRFLVAMVDAHGTSMPDPDPSHFNMGGMGGPRSLAPGASWCQTLPLARYARYDAPGAYTIRVGHDLGWPAGTAPTGETTIRFVAPSAVEAEGVVRAMDALPPERRIGTDGKKDPPYADFTTLRHAVYLAPLVARATQGSAEAMEGLGQIPTPEATRALVRLLDSSKPELARGAASALALRLPDPALAVSSAPGLGPRNPFFNELPEQRKYLIGVGWAPDQAEPIRVVARRLLASSTTADVQNAAFMLEAVGTKDDAPPVVRALSTAIDRTLTTPREGGVAPTPRAACQELMRAIEVLVMRGYPAPAQPSTPGELALWLVASGRAATLVSTPASTATYARALGHPIPYVRRLALERAPDPLPAALVPAVRANLATADIDTQLAASAVASGQHLTVLGPELVAALRTAQDHYLLGVLSGAARDVGAFGPRVDALVDRLSEPTLTTDVLYQLLELFGRNGASGGGEVTAAQASAVQVAWRAFVKQHRADIDAGRSLVLDEHTPKALVPPGYVVNRDQLPDWPTAR